MADSFSKPIQKTDDSAKELIIEALEGQATGGFDLDSVYRVKDTYYVLEFLKCDTVKPFDSHPRRYWFKNSQKFLSLWDITTKLGGRLYLVNYEDSREQFKVIRVLDMDYTGIKKELVKLWNFDQFKKWFKALNNLSSERESAIENVEETEKQVIRPLIHPEYKPGFIPLYTLRAACGYFGEGRLPEEEGWIDASGLGFTPDPKRHFAVHAKGDSMLPKIKDGDICIFEWYTAGSRNGEIVLSQISEYDDAYDGRYTIKRYQSEKTVTDEGWQHSKVELQPLNPDFDPIELSEDDDVRTIGIFKCVLLLNN